MQSNRLHRLKAFWLAAVLAVTSPGLTGCRDQTSAPVPVVKLSVWWSDETESSLINSAIESFQEKYAGEANFEITVSRENVLTSKETVLANPEAAADIFVFADDQFDTLRQAGALLEITENTESVIAANGGRDNGACRAAMYNDKLYACPLTSGNGYFLYYNAKYFSDEDVKNLDRILDISAENGKKTAIDYSSGWYIYSFFRAAGLQLHVSEDGLTNYCNWNADDTPYTGVDVANAMLDIAAHKGFTSCDDVGFINGVKNGTIIAGVNGAWNAQAVKEAWGDDFATAKLPEFTLAGDQVQMCSFSGYKLVGVNSASKNSDWAVKLAEYLSSEEMQLRRFEITGECPSNLKAAASPAVQSSPAVAALSEQSAFADAQRITDACWHPSYVFGTIIAGENPDNQDLQTLLDNMTDEITAAPQQKGPADETD